MRIIDSDGRRDYYDGVATQYHDPDVLYVRRGQEVALYSTAVRTDFREIHGIISFCEKIYPYINIIGSGIFYDYESWKKCFDNCNVGDRYRMSSTTRAANFFNITANPFQEDIHAKYKCPIWAHHTGMLYINPILRHWEFFKVLPPVEAYQELRRYVTSGKLSEPPKQPLPISDDDMRDMKGFDKHSFRRGKTKKRFK